MPLCPVCHEPLVAVEEEDVSAAACGNCRGTWISAKALERRTHIEANSGHPQLSLESLPDLAATVAASDTTRQLICPDCLQSMVKERFHTKIPVQIDRCEKCEHIWLDAGEQALLLKLYRELVSGQQEQVAARQATVDQFAAAHSQAISYSSDTSQSRALDIALQIGGAVLNIFVDILLSSGSRSSRRW